MARELTAQQVEAKRQREGAVVTEMIAAFCRGKHGTERGQLCEECQALTKYAQLRIYKCPAMATKTFCSQCKIHCYKPVEREQIRQVMRYAGPRMMLSHPLMAAHHGIDTLSVKLCSRGR